MAKAKYKKNSRGEFETKIWDDTYNADGSKHRKKRCRRSLVPTDIRNSHFQEAINNAQDKPRTCQQIYITFKQILKNAVSDNYIGAEMFDMLISDINLPAYWLSNMRTRCGH